MEDLIKKIFSSKTKSGRVFRTILQAFVGLSGFALLLLADNNFYNWIADMPLIIQIGGMAILVGFVSAVQNYSKVLWDKVKDL